MTLPGIDVAVTRTPGSGSPSVLVTRPRMTSVPCACAFFDAAAIMVARPRPSARREIHERRITESSDDRWGIEAPTMRVVDAEANP